jgi:hypothetical protein
MKALALLALLLLAVLLLPTKHPATPRPSGHEPLRPLVPVRVVRSRCAAQVPKTVRTVGHVANFSKTH